MRSANIMTRRWLRHGLLAVGVALFAWLLHRVGPGSVLAMARQLGWGLTLVVAVFAAQQLARARALHTCILRRDRPRFLDVVLIRLSGEGLQALTAGGAAVGEPVKAWLLTQRGLSGPEGLAATLAEFLVYKVVSAVVMVTALVYLLAAVPLPATLAVAARILLVVGIAFLVAATVCIGRRIYLIGAVVSALARLPFVRRWPYDPMWTRRMEDHLLEVLRDRPRTLMTVIALSGIAHVLLVVELWWVLVRFDLPSPLFNAALIDAATKPMGGIFFFVPGQVGTNEAVLAAVFHALGLPAAAGVVVSLTRRLRSALLTGVGLAGLWWFERKPRGGSKVAEHARRDRDRRGANIKSGE
jgi:uncharacterized protein (TIRG00374 family)